MSHDVQVALQVRTIFLVVAAICVTIFPLLYLRSPWYKSNLGRALMIQSVSVAFAIDISTVFHFWKFTADLFTLLIINIVMFGFIAGSSLFLTIMLFYYNFKPNKESEHV